jgi:hypothetical protein
MKTLNPNKLPLIDYNELVPLQGELKDLTEVNYNKLHNSFKKYGFFVPIFVWHNEDQYKILDGHQRLRVLQKEHIEFENTETKVPCLIVEADNLQDAKEKVLQISSQFGKITYEGWSEFVADLNEAELIQAVSFDALGLLGEDSSLNLDEEDGEQKDYRGEVVITLKEADYNRIKTEFEGLLDGVIYSVKQV